MALYKKEEKANFSCMNVVSCELTYEKYFRRQIDKITELIGHNATFRALLLSFCQDLQARSCAVSTKEAFFDERQYKTK